MLRPLLATLIFILLATMARATHMSGGEIYYECIGTDQYRITMVIYRDCFGIDVDPSYTLQVQSPCGNTTLVVSTPGGIELSQLCDTELPNSTCNGGNLPGIQQYIYTGIITLPPCDSWTLSYTNIYRNAAIANLFDPGAQRTYIRATINTADAPCNDSPQFTNTAIPYVCLGYPISYSFGAFDPENDSLVYSLITAMGINGAPLNYVAPHSGPQPIPGLTLDPQSGEINFTLNQIGNWVVVVQVEHWNSDGVMVGTVMRDMQFVAYPCSNDPPDPTTGIIENLTGNAVQTGPRGVELCESGDFCFDMVISDPNATNVLDAFSNIQQNLPGATFSFTGDNPITATVCWMATPGSAGYFPFFVNADDNACPIPAFQTYVYGVRVLPGPTVELEVTDQTCTGNADGSLSALVTGGSAPYSYEWNTASSEASIVGGAGDYSVTVTDGNGCTTGPVSGVIGTTGLPNEAEAGDDLVGCMNALPINLSGNVVNATGGTWSGGGGTIMGTGLDVTYMPGPEDLALGGVELTLTTTGNETCPPASDVVYIAIPNSFQDASATATDASCNGGADGSASFLPEDPGFSYLWNDPEAQTTATANDLGPDNYMVLVTDAFGCDTSITVTVGQPEAIAIASLTAAAEGCLGDGNGSAAVTASGGTAPYFYAWSNGANTPDITATSGSYTVTVTDANGCAPAEGDITIDALGIPNEALAGPDLVGCMNALPIDLTGNVVNATGGIWSGGGGTITGTGLDVTYMPGPEDIAQGGVELTLTTTGNEACPPASDVVYIALPNSFQNASATATDASCNGGADGSASFLPEDPGFSYLWNDPAAQTMATAHALEQGNYLVIATDAYGCDTSITVTVGEPEAIAIASLTAEAENCLGDGNGTATVTASGGTAPYTYGWSTGANTPTITATTGTYTVVVTDANGCAPAEGDVAIDAMGQPNEALAGPDQVACLDALPIPLNGSVVNATGGVWAGGAGVFQDNGLNALYMPTVAELQSGSVELTITTTGNTYCPPDQDTLLIHLSNSFLVASLTTTHVDCHGNATGSISALPAAPSLTYLWNDPQAQTTSAATGLVPGTWSVTITDTLGCDTTLTTTITQPEALVLDSLMAQHITCPGGNDGTATVFFSGGTAGHQVQWNSNGQQVNGSSATALGAGPLTVTVTDAQGCVITADTVLTAPPPIILTATVPDTVCINAPVTLEAQADGGNGGLVIQWSGIGTGASLEHQFGASQNVLVNVMDMAGCQGPTLSLPVFVLDLGQASLTTSGGGTFCPGDSATIGAQLSGYPGAYQITWSTPGANGSAPFTIPVNGTEDILATVTDACGETLEGLVPLVLEVPPTIQLPPVIAEGCAPLTVQFPDGLTDEPVTWNWDLGDGNSSTAPAPVHTYEAGIHVPTLTVTTPAGCTATALGSGLIIAHEGPAASFTADMWESDMDAPTFQFTDGSDGDITTWTWYFGDGSSGNSTPISHTYEAPGTYTVLLLVQDVNGCPDEVMHEVHLDPVHDVVIPNAFTPSQDGGGGGGWIPGDLSNDVFYPFADHVKELRLRIFDRWGELIFESKDPGIGWDGYYRGELSPQDVYVYQVWVKFVDDKEVMRMGDLTLFR